jgi:hypothetical protein
MSGDEIITDAMWARFVSKADVRGPDDCWLWKAAQQGGNPAGDRYGAFNLDGTKIVGAHRVSYLRYKGPILEGMEVRHTCDVKLCVNPAHLLTGTRSQNIMDRSEIVRAISAAKARAAISPEQRVSRIRKAQATILATRRLAMATRSSQGKSIDQPT